MSFLTDEFGKHLLRNLWPDGRSFAIGEDPADVPSCFWWQTVPRDVDELTSWFRIVERPKPCDPSRPYMVVNKSDIEDPEEDEEEVYEVDLRLQGVLGKHNLGPLGNWKGTPETAQKAVQWLELHGADYPGVWTQTLDSLNLLGDVVAQTIESGTYAPMFDPSKLSHIHMQRRVFDKAPHSVAGKDVHVPSGVTHRTAELIMAGDNKWIVDPGEKLELAKKTGRGDVFESKHIFFKEGQFVDVTAAIDIIIRREKDKASQPKPRIQLRLKRVVLLPKEHKSLQKEPKVQGARFRVKQRAGFFAVTPMTARTAEEHVELSASEAPVPEEESVGSEQAVFEQQDQTDKDDASYDQGTSTFNLVEDGGDYTGDGDYQYYEAGDVDAVPVGVEEDVAAVPAEDMQVVDEE